MSSDILSRLDAVLATRRHGAAESSYVASLHAKGLDAILKKIGEESTETVMAAKDGDPQSVTRELADLWFHSMALLSHLDLDSRQVLEELERRFGRSGIDEKNARKGHS